MGLLLDQVTYRQDGNLVPEDKREKMRDMDIPQISDDDFQERLEEINKTYQIIRDPQTGRAFEIAIVNESQLKYGAILMPSTMFSSLTQNIGNAIELAASGAATPNTARVYVAFPGNGGSDSLSRQDRQHLANTGCFTQDGKALDSILSALVRALGDKGKDIPIKSI